MNTLDIGPFDERQPFEVTDEEGQCLAWLARETTVGEAIVEIGSYRGRSTCYLAQGSLSGPKLPVVAVDLWTEHPDYHLGARNRKIQSVYNKVENKLDFMNRIERFGFIGIVKAVQGDSRLVAKEWRGGPKIGLLFVDGSHTRKDVIRDFRAWSKYIPKGGRVVFHDYHYRRVRKGIEQILKTHSEWDTVGLYERLYAIERTG